MCEVEALTKYQVEWYPAHNIANRTVSSELEALEPRDHYKLQAKHNNNYNQG